MTPAALITGGGGDLARAIHAELGHQGWLVHAPGHAELDVTDAASASRYFGRLESLDLLIHNAGIVRDASLAKMSHADFDSVLAVHLRGAFLCARAALEIMVRQRQGHLIMIGSFSAMEGPSGQTNYAAAKAGLIGLTQSLAAEYGASDIRVNCVLPGFLATRMTAALPEEVRERARARHALGRFNTAGDAARFVVFLHSMGHVSGQVFQLDSRVRRWT